MPDDSLQRLCLLPGMLLFQAGDPGAAAYLIESGCLEIFIIRTDGELVLARRGPGEIVGEMAILDQRPRSASARAVEKTSLVLITEQQVAHRLSETDPILKMCLGVIIERYRETVSLLNMASGACAPVVSVPAKTSIFTTALEHLVLEREMRAAIANDEFELFFQPIIHLATGKLTGFEALMRWNHPKHGLMPPDQFIPLAEASGLIAELTDWALGQVGYVFPRIMMAATSNVRAICAPLFMSVNISGHDLAKTSFMSGLVDLMNEAGINPSNLKIEITESVLMKDPAKAAAALNICRAGGLGIAIDDFGTGYSSLSYLSTLPITTLKIDRAFIRSILTDPKSRKIVQTILRLADELDIPVVAEGIEQAAEAEMLEAMGCTFGQGFLFGRPIPLALTLDLVRTWMLPSNHMQRAIA